MISALVQVPRTPVVLATAGHDTAAPVAVARDTAAPTVVVGVFDEPVFIRRRAVATIANTATAPTSKIQPFGLR